MGSEIRRVPPNWEHPTDGDGSPIPLYDGWRFAQDVASYELQRRVSPPDPTNYMPRWSREDRTHLQAYECTTEGTPISPVFATAEELARWLEEHAEDSFAGWLSFIADNVSGERPYDRNIPVATTDDIRSSVAKLTETHFLVTCGAGFVTFWVEEVSAGLLLKLAIAEASEDWPDTLEWEVRVVR